jgi:hypothetical protein
MHIHVGYKFYNKFFVGGNGTIATMKGVHCSGVVQFNSQNLYMARTVNTVIYEILSMKLSFCYTVEKSWVFLTSFRLSNKSTHLAYKFSLAAKNKILRL